MVERMRIYAEVDLDAIRFNIDAIRSKIGAGTKILAVVKADGYGHGAIPLAHELKSLGVYGYGVATIGEARALRINGIDSPILILGFVFPAAYDRLVQYDIMPTVFQYETAKLLSHAAKSMGKQLKIHIKIDTGMGRIGFVPSDESLEEIKKIAKLDNVIIDGVFTHLSCADTCDTEFTQMQLKRFEDFVDRIENSGIHIPIKHFSNSAGVLTLNRDYMDMVRCGIITYGLYPSDEVKNSPLKLRPAMQIKSHVAYIKTVGKGDTISYGATYTASKPTRVATIPVGYADGYPRALSNKGRVLINGCYANIIGRVCMDQLMVDVTDIDDVRQDDVVTIFGSDGGKTISVDEVAEAAGVINYEIICGISSRVPRLYVSAGKIVGALDYNEFAKGTIFMPEG